MNIVDLINKKRNNQKLTLNEIKYIINGFLTDEIKDYQMTSLLMAICINGLNVEEIYHLTECMLNSGETIDLSSISGVKVDKHSTGGIGDKTTLIVGPIVAALGVPVCKMSGRGLGYTGGTIDKLESIPGLNVNISIDNFIKEVSEIGICLATNSNDVAPADKKIYALRDVSGTVSSKALIASSIMSKKLATGTDKILLDVKYGNGALMETKEDATELARLMVFIGNSYGKETKALITNMNYPLGNMIGNSLEIKEAIDILNNKGNKDLRDLSIVLASYMVSMSKNIDFISAEREVLYAIESGIAYKKFLELVNYQGGDLSLLKISNKIIEVKSNTTGYINNINALMIGASAMKLGAGRRNKDDPIDHSVGIEIVKNIGEYVIKGDVIAKIYIGNRVIDYDDVRNAFTIETEKTQKDNLIYGVIK